MADSLNAGCRSDAASCFILMKAEAGKNGFKYCDKSKIIFEYH
ncbi:MAG: hypothetical protein HGGPFJEG_00037 [Ignavibacteria bacterium]|nr:hypothetical protein [Ignavibacteria bacterium]